MSASAAATESLWDKFDDVAWLAWGRRNLTPEEFDRRLVAVNLDRELVGKPPLDRDGNEVKP